MSSDFTHNPDINTWLHTLEERVMFTNKTLDYIGQDIIRIIDDLGQILYLRIDSREWVEDELGQEVRLQFRVETESQAASGSPVVTLWYTLNSGLSLEENHHNLRDFVLSHLRTVATMPTILPRRTSEPC